jgi:hypothetical protein
MAGDNGSDLNTTNTADKLRFELVRVQIEAVRLELQGMRTKMDDQEARIRKVETAATKFDFLLYLTMGGGLVGLVNLALLAITLVKAVAAP